MYFQESFARAQSWISELQKQASPNIIIALAGNKTDLENLRAVQYDVCVMCTFILSILDFCFGDHSLIFLGRTAVLRT